MNRNLTLMGLGTVALLVVALLLDVGTAAAFGILPAMLLGQVIQDLSEQTTPEDMKVRDVSDALTYMDESAEVPLDQFMRRLPSRTKPVENIMIEWAHVDKTPPRVDQVGSSGFAGEGAGDEATYEVTNSEMWRPNDVIAVPDVEDVPLQVVRSVDNTAGTITVLSIPTVTTKTTAAQDYVATPALAADTKILRIATSKTEFDKPSQSRMTMPKLLFNYVHTFDAVVRSSDHRIRTKNYTMQDWTRVRADNLVDFRRSIEYNMFFGKPSVTLDPSNNELRWTMGGILHYCSDNLLTYTPEALTESMILDWHRMIFTGNTGSQNRVLFADALLATEIDKIMLNRMEHMPERTIAGVQTTEFRTRVGTTYIVHHPGFDDLQRENFGVFVDLKHVHKGSMQATERIPLELKKTGQADGEAEQYIEKCTLEVGNTEPHWIVEGA